VWFAHEDKAVREEFIAVCTDLVKRGPALGIIPFFATQKPDAKSIPTAIADNAVARLCFKVNGQQSNDQVLGTSSYRQGVRATQFGFADKGVAYYVGEGADSMIVRTVFGLDATAADEMAAKVRANRLAKGRLTGDAAGETTEQVFEVSIIDDTLDVLQGPDNRGRNMSLAGLRECLALLRPGTWGHLDVEALGGMLRQAGVTPRSVHCPGEGRSMQGVKLDWVTAAKASGLSDAG
jgi:S-DNA-T family DNA segregation ATPase FtsK/SpoIIIE